MANSWYLEGPPRLHVRRLGAGDSHVVMIHGIVTGSLASWLLTSAPKVAKEHAVTLFDMLGHGLSGSLSSVTATEHGFPLGLRSDGRTG